MRVLVACEFSGTVRDAFAALGHEAWSCDLEPSETEGNHIVGDVLDHLEYRSPGNLGTDGWRTGARWDLLITHPPCKFLASSGMHWTTRGLRDPQHTVDAIKFAEALWNAPVHRIAVENPVGALSTRSKLGKSSQTIQPYHFGEDASKKTCLWLKNLPLLKKTKFIKPRMVCQCGRVMAYDEDFKHGCPDCGPGLAKPRWANQTDSGQNKLGPSDTRVKERSKTYAGIAAAMAKQWGGKA